MDQNHVNVKRKLEECIVFKTVRMHDEAQSTKLLKLQQNERNINNDFLTRKKEMNKIVSDLASRVDKFHVNLKKMNDELGEKKDNFILKNDNRKLILLNRQQEELRRAKELDIIHAKKKQIAEYSYELKEKRLFLLKK